jgi:hypothetical protein
LSELKSYQSFPKQAEWIDSAVAKILG